MLHHNGLTLKTDKFIGSVGPVGIRFMGPLAPQLADRGPCAKCALRSTSARRRVPILLGYLGVMAGCDGPVKQLLHDNFADMKGDETFNFLGYTCPDFAHCSPVFWRSCTNFGTRRNHAPPRALQNLPGSQNDEALWDHGANAFINRSVPVGWQDSTCEANPGPSGCGVLHHL
jgi:hypothetical protein